VSTEQYLTQIDETTRYIIRQAQIQPRIGIILGTGLGGLVAEIDIESTLSYSDIPNFPLSTVEFHEGKLIFGKLGGKQIVAMQGRFHYYEGYSMKQITFPVRVMKKLGIHTLLISNACGGMNPLFTRGDLMLIEDHINLIGDNPLIGQNLDDFGPRFPDMSEPYSHDLISMAEKIALEHKIKVQKGVFVAVSGPNLETRAEYRFLRQIGADVVGMSTVPENIVAVHSGLKVLGISVITDECFPDALKPVDIDEIIQTAKNAEPNLTLIMKKVIEQI
jgi:purine-nucleoside phosphorylase